MFKIFFRYFVLLRKYLNVIKVWYFYKLVLVYLEGDIKDLNIDNVSDVCVEFFLKIIEVWIFEGSF